MGTLLVLPLGLGLLGFIEPCTVGASLLFVYYLEGRPPAEQLAQTIVFAIVRAAFMGTLGLIAVALGAIFVTGQKAAWAVMGALYVMLGLVYLSGRIERLKLATGIGLQRLQGRYGAALLGAIFALNIPACAGPLLLALLGAAAIAEGAEVRYLRGFVMLATFGLALTLPLVVAARWERGRRLLDWLGRFSASAPRIIGGVFVLLGLWSIRFALVAKVL